MANALEEFFRTREGSQQERQWNDGREEIVQGIASLVSNYPPDDAKSYTSRKIRAFLEIAGFSQIAFISSAAPHVDAIITENHQAEVLDKAKRRDDFLGDLRVFTLRDFRDAPP